jgi:hypothetical protein
MRGTHALLSALRAQVAPIREYLDSTQGMVRELQVKQGCCWGSHCIQGPGFLGVGHWHGICSLAVTYCSICSLAYGDCSTKLAFCPCTLLR